MALFSNLLRPEVAIGVAVGLATVALAPIVLPAVASAARPLARRAIKTGIILHDQARETLAELGEIFEDLAAEARAELEQERDMAYRDVAAEEPAGDTKPEGADSTPSPA